MKQHGVLYGLLFLLLCMNVNGFDIRRFMDSTSPVSSTQAMSTNGIPTHQPPPHKPTTEAPTPKPSTPTPTQKPTTQAPTPKPPTPTPTQKPTTEAPTQKPTPYPTQHPTNKPPTPKPHPPSQGGPIGNFFKCAKGFKLVKFCVKEIYITNSTSEIRSLETNELIGTAAGNCPDVPETVSPTGSGLLLQSCVFTYNLFNRGRFVETGLFDPSPNGISNNAISGIDGEFFHALGLEHIRNFPDASGAIDEFLICEPLPKKCENKEKEHEHNKEHNHDKDDGKNQHDGNGDENDP